MYDKKELFSNISLLVIIGLYVRVDISLTRGKHLYDCVNSLRGNVRPHKSIITPLLLMEMLVPSWNNKQC